MIRSAEVTNGRFWAEITLGEEDSTCRAFTKELSRDLSNIFRLVRASFSLKISEQPNHETEESWQISAGNYSPELQAVILDSKKRKLLKTTAVQHYVAVYPQAYAKNYCGKVCVQLLMTQDDAVIATGNDTPKNAKEVAESLVWTVLGCYYRKITEHYGTWQTSYLDAADIQSVTFGPETTE